ncbi:MAG: N-acetylmuramoyl-L-alanine amidase [Ruminococcaceae bacterium]|nr:N-acetylmuramoyl-L-alanine amidase [Oscillospiraceae bacterium]
MAIKIYIDQGHNPESPNAGAEGNGLREQDLVFRIGIETKRLLDANPDFEARLSRPTIDTQLGTSNASSLRARVDDANAWGADLFLSLHCNASVDTTVSGSEALVFSRFGTSYNIAEVLLTSLTEATGLRNRGVLVRPGLYVLRRTAMPAVLLELGFITNPSDAILLRDNPTLFAQGIYNGIVRYYG